MHRAHGEFALPVSGLLQVLLCSKAVSQSEQCVQTQLLSFLVQHNT